MVAITSSGMVYWRSLSWRIVSSGWTSNDQSVATAMARFTSVSSNAAGVPAFSRTKIRSGRPALGSGPSRRMR